jgi:hypothetical protein
MPFFDYPRIAQEAGIPPDKLDRLIRVIREEFPGDDMMADLHIMRACRVVRDGHATIDEVLAEAPVGAHS